jgi:hypothetical protein
VVRGMWKVHLQHNPLHLELLHQGCRVKSSLSGSRRGLTRPLLPSRSLLQLLQQRCHAGGRTAGKGRSRQVLRPVHTASLQRLQLLQQRCPAWPSAQSRLSAARLAECFSTLVLRWRPLLLRCLLQLLHKPLQPCKLWLLG